VKGVMVLTTWTDRKLWEVTRPQEQVGQVGSVEGDVQGRRDVRQHVEDGTSEPIGQRHM
jgi:hypothetical protein